MEKVYIDLLMVIYIKVIGKMINNKVMEFLCLLMDRFIKGNLVKDNLMGKENINIIQNNLMIYQNITDLGNHHNLMVMVKQFITMEIYMKVNL
jgi:hypothetical protein